MKIAIDIGGGDAPGPNAVICALLPVDGESVLTARTLGIAFSD